MTTFNSRIRKLLLGSVATILFSGTAFAQGNLDNQTNIRIQAQSLNSAIEALANQADISINTNSVRLSDLRAPTVSGTMSVREALSELLRGTNFSYRTLSDGSIVVEPATMQSDEIIVTGTRLDPLNLLQKGATDSLTGLSLSLLETPRAASRVSEITIDRYGMQDVDDLLAAVPGTFTASFFGVPGNLNVRGTLADTYFQGFKRIENRGTYSSNLSAASYVEVLRGPSSPIYGPGKVGGLLNFMPKTARGENSKYVDELSGSLNVTAGSYDKTVFSGEISIPVGNGGFHFFGEHEDSDSYYQNIHPKHTNLQGTYVGDIDEQWSVEFNLMYFTESGRIQSPGWNRLTQDLVDNGNYITGRDTDIRDLDGDGYLNYGEIDTAIGSFFGTSNIRQIAEFFGSALPEFALDEGVGITKLDGSQIFADEGDYNNTETITGYAALERVYSDDSKFSFQLFVDHMENQKFNSFGFAADYEATAVEGRASYSFNTSFGDNLTADSVVGIAHRRHNAKQYESFLSGYVALDRRDLSFGATSGDRILAPNMIGGEPAWDSRRDMKWNSSSVFGMSDIKLFNRFSILAGLRYDYFDLQAINTGETVFGVANTLVKGDSGAVTWSLSGRYETPFGVTPYITYAEPRSLESSQTGGVSEGTIGSGLYISPSKLKEAGIKFSILDGNLFGSFAYYEQFRRQTDLLGNISGTTAEGFEAEIHWLATDNLSFTTSFTKQETNVDAPGAGRGEYLQVRPDQFGVDGILGYGGTFAFNNAGYVPSLADGYTLSTIPDIVASVYGTYTTNPFTFFGGNATAGITAGGSYVSETGGIFENDIVLPSYTLAKIAAFVEFEQFTLSVNVDNLFDKRYFTPSAEVYKEVAVMPGLPRIFRVSLSYDF
ncbi:TonB-dependent siderophore receptor [Hyphococcus lacteus]|uniref:TonB-dependent receptor n=1 Tax=Hyphococcus lacteus TaxID=3143536 RepID=A0ABV3Z758_9PROT